MPSVGYWRSLVQAAEVALDGVVQEEQVGSRTILDVLDAEQELLDARSNLVVATRNEVVASLELRQVVGTLTAHALALPVTPYDPEDNYRRGAGQVVGCVDQRAPALRPGSGLPGFRAARRPHISARRRY